MTFSTGMAYSVDMSADQIVVRLRMNHPTLHIIVAVLFKGFESKWSTEWLLYFIVESDFVK